LPELYGPFRITLSGAYGERTGYALDASRHLEKTHEQKMDDATKG
jgi:delta-aminolevulinic acid dehydratase/porphobilinogen synthase